MISRIWHGYATPENADTYETLLKDPEKAWMILSHYNNTSQHYDVKI